MRQDCQRYHFYLVPQYLLLLLELLSIPKGAEHPQEYKVQRGVQKHVNIGGRCYMREN